MAHLFSVIFFYSLLAGLAMLLQRSLWENRSAIRAALLGAGRTEDVQLPETALERVGACLRISFPPIAGALNDGTDLLFARLARNLAHSAPQPATAAVSGLPRRRPGSWAGAPIQSTRGMEHAPHL